MCNLTTQIKILSINLTEIDQRLEKKKETQYNSSHEVNPI